MSQNWIAVDLDARVWLDGAGKLDDWFCHSAALALEALRVPCTNDAIDSLLTGRFADQHAAPLLRLPPELLHDIIDELYPTGAYAPAVFLFAVTCRRTLTLAQPHIARLQRRHFAPLAGHRLVCVADGPGTLAGCPAGLFTKADMCALEDGSADAPLYALVRKAWPRYIPDPPALLRPMDLIWRPSAVSRMSMGDFGTFRRICEPCCPPSATWVLRSASRREYVRADGLCEGDPKRLLWAAVLACVSCIPEMDASKRVGVAVPPVRGRWAGDRIEVTALDHLEVCSDNGAAWTDVTESVVSLVHELRKTGVHPWVDLAGPEKPDTV